MTVKKKATRCPVCLRPEKKANGASSKARNACRCAVTFKAAAAVVKEGK
jgi:hypothetical protein